MKSVESLRRSSFLNALLSLLGFLIVLCSLGYSAYQLHRLEKNLSKKQQQVEKLDRIIHNLSSTQNSLLDFLGSVTGQHEISILDPSVDWEKTKQDIIKMPGGKRKDAVLTAILLAWKDVPFTMGSNKLDSGFDSPRFVQYVLKKTGVHVQDVPGERLSDTMMRCFTITDKPSAGDIAFFRGQVGSFCLILASPGNEKTAPVGIGTLQKIAPLQVISLNNINTRYFPLIGYFHVKYPDEQ
jgi:hypothetical protein